MTAPRTSNETVKAGTAGKELPRSERLLRHADFERVYKLGQRHFSASLTAFYVERQQATAGGAQLRTPQGLRVGFTVGRALGGAVERNRIKRRMREAVRLSRPPFGIAADVVMNPKKSLLTADFADLLNEVCQVFVVIERKLAGRGAGSLGDDRGSRAESLRSNRK